MHSKNLVWIDLEMTGLFINYDKIIEIAAIVTDSELNILETGPVIAIHQPLKRLIEMNEWNTKTHTQSGLVNRVKKSQYNEQEAEKKVLQFISSYVGEKQSPLCGNSIHQDRRFLARYMPKLESYLHYRNLDVSSVKELVIRWRPELLCGLHKENTHQAMYDILDSISELNYYRKTFFNVRSSYENFD